MIFYSKKYRSSVLILLGIAFTITSCVDSRKATYFNDLKDTTFVSQMAIEESLIQKNDIINISVSSLNPEASLIFNSPVVTPGPGSTQVSGYLVNNHGILQFPVLGNIQAAGMTKDKLKDVITKGILDKKLLLDPIVSIRIQTFRVTVLGEVKNPSSIPVPNEKITLLEAIGLAGDLTIYAKRDNVLLIREEEGVKTIRRLNLNSTELFTSPYYYLKSNDIVYVEPNKTRIATAGRSQVWLPVAISALSVAIIVLDRVIK